MSLVDSFLQEEKVHIKWSSPKQTARKSCLENYPRFQVLKKTHNIKRIKERKEKKATAISHIP